MTADVHVPLYLCCAEDNEIALVKVVDALHKEGRAPEVLAGIEADGMMLSNAVDRANGPALFVLCQSDQLDRAHLRRLEGLFSARKGPRQKLVTVTLVPGKPLAVLTEIRKAIESFKSRAPAAQAEDGRVLMRDVVGPTKVSAVRATSEQERLARQLHDEMVAAEAMLSRRARPTPDPEEEPQARADDGAEPGAPSMELMDEGASALPSDVGEAEAEHGSSGTRRERVPESDDSLDDSVAVPSGVEVTQDRETDSDDELEITGPTPRGGSDAARSHPSAATAAERPVNRFLLASGVVGIAVLGVLAVFYLGDDPEPAPARYPRTDRNAEQTPAKVNDNEAAPESDAPKRAKPPVSAIPPAPAAPVEAETAGEPDPSEEDRAVPEPPESDPETQKHEGPKEPEPVPPSPPSKPRDKKADALAQALGDGTVRATGRLLMLLGSGGETQTWTHATSTCRSRRIGGVIGGWRLPSAAQVKKLAAAGLIEGGTYWTKEQGETEDEAYAVDSTSGAKNLYLTMEPTGRTVCVRNKP